MSDRPYFCNVCQLPASACQCSEFARLRSEADALRARLKIYESGQMCCPRAEKAERRVSVLTGRLRRVLSAATWAHNFHVDESGFGKVLRRYGCVWSRRRGSDRGRT